MKLRSINVLAICALSAGTALAADAPSAESFETVAAIFKTHCVKCHGPTKQAGKLNLALPAGIVRGGENGAAIVAGKPEESLLWQQVADDDMPKEEEPLSVDDKEWLRRWIAGGAPGLPAKVAAAPDGDEHWAFQKLPTVAVPAVRDASRIRTPIDAFVQSQLEAKGLALGPEANRETLIRRVAFDLTGLPPTLEEIDAFVGDGSAHAYEGMVEQYMASPHYGERWGKYWLDVAGYADSNGYFNADTDRPLAYRYRDYVIRATNADKPWDQFIREQLAGDELAGYRRGGEVKQEMVELLEAVHYLRNCPDGTDSSDGNADEVRADKFAVLEGTLQIVGSSLLGITVQCARCHDHKFEPFSQRDYYRLQAVIYPAFNVEQWQKPTQRDISTATAAERQAWEAQVKQIDDQIAERRKVLADLPKEPATEIDGEAKKLAEQLAKQRSELDAAIKELEAQRPKPVGQLAAVSEPAAERPKVHLLNRGEYKSPGEEVLAGAPVVLASLGSKGDVPATDATLGSTGQRLALARWITEPNSRPAALLARVTVNRWWQHHFGAGLVATVDNLGYSGTAPSHQALLDYLAAEFVRQGWSAKAIHRMILHSAIYRQASQPTSDTERLDPNRRLLARYPLRRLDGEAIRDAMLAVSGELDPQRFGPYVPTQRSGAGDVVVAENTAGALRRSVYLQQRRTQVVGMLEVFDAPSIVSNCAARSRTTVPLQSLELLNSAFVRSRAAGFARRMQPTSDVAIDSALERAFRTAWGRRPTDEELSSARQFLAAQPEKYVGQANAAQLAWTDFCQSLIASSPFLYVE